MTRPHFTLAVVASTDGYIARHSGHGPWEWASAEEQAIFLAEVAAADWAIMGRGTHEAAPRPDRRRIIFSASAPDPEWRQPTHLWLDPAPHTPDGLAALVAPVHPLRRGLILGATRVHDWFHAAGRIDRVLLTIEPVTFGTGIPVFTGMEGPADSTFARLGYRTLSERPLNATGTRFLDLAGPNTPVPMN
jgi:dihydrofolate reductase